MKTFVVGALCRRQRGDPPFIQLLRLCFCIRNVLPVSSESSRFLLRIGYKSQPTTLILFMVMTGAAAHAP